MKLFVGVDIGSTTAKCVIVDENDKMLVFSHIPTEYDRNVSGEKILKIALDEIGAAESDVAYLVSTGYGRKSFLRADMNIPEIIAHGLGTWHMMPGTRTIIDIGGQDSKVIELSDMGVVERFEMNDKQPPHGPLLRGADAQAARHPDGGALRPHEEVEECVHHLQHVHHLRGV